MTSCNPNSHHSGSAVLNVFELNKASIVTQSGGHSGLICMVSEFESGASGPGSSPGRGHCAVLLGKILYNQGASLHQGI